MKEFESMLKEVAVA